MDFRSKIGQFLYGRYITYGIDILTKILAVVCILLSIINLFVSSLIIYLIETALIFWMLYRLFSRNISKRLAENQKARSFFEKLRSGFTLKRRMFNDRATHIYKKCPHCSVMLRLPKKTGEHTVNCPRCKNNFKVKVR